MLNDIIKVKDQVEYILEEYPKTRDDDKLCWLAHLVLFCGLEKTLGAEAYNKFRLVLISEKTPTMESVTRARRSLQEHQPSLRGKNYNKRREEAEKVYDYYADALIEAHAKEHDYDPD